MKTHTPRIVNHGLWADHDIPCCVNWNSGQPAILDLGTGIFYPSDKAKKDGWMLICAPKWLRPLLKFYERQQ